jgi:hypothetical protein
LKEHISLAKKSTRPNLPKETLERARREMAQSGTFVEEPVQPAAPGQPAAVAAAPRVKRPVIQADLRTEYAYVVNDLRNMATLAAAFMIILVALSFVI